MEQYVALIRDARKSGGGLGFLVRYGWSTEKWAKVQGQVTAGMISASRSSYAQAVGGAQETYRKRITEIEAQLPTATGDGKQALEMELEALRATAAQLSEEPGEATELDRKNMATLERWLPRIQEAEGGK